MNDIIPSAHNRFCVRHMWSNFHKQWKNKDLTDLLWEAARSYTDAGFNKAMETMKARNYDAWEYLMKFPQATWSKSGFSPVPKNDALLNNACEQFNGTIAKYRSKPIITMAEEIRHVIIRKMNKVRGMAERCKGPLTPKAKSRLDRNIVQGKYWTPQWLGDAHGSNYEVENLPHKEVVNLLAMTCTCNEWQITGLPCRHACACYSAKGEDPEQYAHPWLTKKVWKMAYTHHIKGITGDDKWIDVDGAPVEPPIVSRKKPGRPKRQRRKENDPPSKKNTEPQKGKLKRNYGKTMCSRCGAEDHNIRTCPIARAARAQVIILIIIMLAYCLGNGNLID